jgi:predicted metal-dependent HD superfamily phosphohydrolase
MFKAIKRLFQVFYLKTMWMTAHFVTGSKVNWNELDYIIARYDEKGRFYHGLNHLEHGLRFLEICAGKMGIERRAYGLLLFAYFYHDVIMNFGRKDNERLSADRARDYTKTILTEGEVQRIENLIMGTQDHQNPKDAHDLPMTDPLWPIMNDTDLLIFSAPWSVYSRYAQNVWEEYSAIVGRRDFVRGRREFLTKFRANPVFRTAGMRRAEGIAVQNMTDELDRLGE